MNKMEEMKGFNMERILLRNKNGYFCFGFYKDGMIQVDYNGEWSRPDEWSGWLHIKQLKKALELIGEYK